MISKPSGVPSSSRDTTGLKFQLTSSHRVLPGAGRADHSIGTRRGPGSQHDRAHRRPGR
jgi:hypothetical protein